MILVNHGEKKKGGRKDRPIRVLLSFNKKLAFQTCVVRTDYNLLRPAPDMSLLQTVSCFLITDSCIIAQWEIKSA